MWRETRLRGGGHFWGGYDARDPNALKYLMFIFYVNVINDVIDLYTTTTDLIFNND